MEWSGRALAPPANEAGKARQRQGYAISQKIDTSRSRANELFAPHQSGDFLRGRRRPVRQDAREDLDIVEAAILTLLALIIGFTFSMAVTRYDQRKNYEEAEANAIGTEYVRADLLPTEDAVSVRELLRRYLDGVSRPI